MPAAPPVTQKMIRNPSVAYGSNKAAPVTQGGLFVSSYIAGKTTRYLARPSS